MRKSVRLICGGAILLFLTVVALSMSACGSNGGGHTHVWGSWQRNETEHWRVCKTDGCNTEEREVHTGEPCSVCAYGFRVLAFGFTQGGDTAHSDFAQEAVVWFAEKGEELGFTFDFAGTDFSRLNDDTLANYEMVMFLNDRPSDHGQQDALERFMRNGGAWMGFHACAFSMDGNNEYWTWYQDEFLGCGNYAKNTWNPTSEPLTIETHDHFATENITEDVFMSAPCEWYGWETGNDLFDNDDMTVLVTLNPTQEDPAGDDPRAGYEYQIWYDGHYPIAWANNNYRMVYMNWGHNLQSYNSFEKESSTFSSEVQNQFMLDAMFGLVV